MGSTACRRAGTSSSSACRTLRWFAAASTVEAGRTQTVDARLRLQLALSADVAVTAKRTFRTWPKLDQPEGGLIGIADAASEGLVTGRQIDARPIMRAGEVLETVPGLIISQHSGEGKANQYYLRGFNLDHGTDFATTRRRHAGQHADPRLTATATRISTS